MRGEVAVAELKPGLAPVLRQPSRNMERLVPESPALLRMHDICERVDQDVRIGRDMQAMDKNVIASIRDHCQLALAAIKSQRELRPSNAPAKQRNLQSIPRG